MLFFVILGNTKEGSGKFSSRPDKDQLMQILSKINSLPLSADLAAKLKGSIPNYVASENQNQLDGNACSPSTKDLLIALSTSPGALSPEAFEIQSHPNSEGSDSEKSKSQSRCIDQAACLNLHRGPLMELPTSGGERSSLSYHSPMEEVEFHAQETSPSLPLQLFSPSPEDYRSMKLPLDRNFLSSGSSNPSVDITPQSSPLVVHDLFPMRISREPVKDNRLSNSVGEIAYRKATMSNVCSTSLQLFGGSKLAAENVSIQSSPYRAGYTSSSGSDHSPSSLNSDAQVVFIIYLFYLSVILSYFRVIMSFIFQILVFFQR